MFSLGKLGSNMFKWNLFLVKNHCNKFGACGPAGTIELNDHCGCEGLKVELSPLVRVLWRYRFLEYVRVIIHLRTKHLPPALFPEWSSFLMD
jgi:hypothetical protein